MTDEHSFSANLAQNHRIIQLCEALKKGGTKLSDHEQACGKQPSNS
ncbi:MAG: hypothetical protein V1777_02925 [Candidatus Micrarchaeota archaeon]